MRKHLLPSALILLLALGLAWAQTINRAIQLSQDASGAFGVDTTNNVYFPGHVLNTGAAGAAPTITGTGGTPTLSGTDVAGTVTMGVAGTQAVVTFGRAYAASPNCMVVWNTGASGLTPISSVVSATGIQMNQNAVSSNRINYFCKIGRAHV